MLTSKIKIVVSRSDLKKKSELKPIVKKASRKAESDSNYYQKAVEALYEAIDVLRKVFVILITSCYSGLKNAAIIMGDKPEKTKTINLRRSLL